MTLALAALVLASLSPPSLVSSASLGQNKVQILKGKKGTGTAKAVNPESAPQQVNPSDASAAKQMDLDRKSAELDAKHKDLSQREQALSEKEASSSEAEKKKADQLKAQQKTIEKIGEGNEKMMQQASTRSAGD